MSAAYTLRPATPADFDFLFALHRAAMRAYIEPIWGWHEDWQLDYFREKFDSRQRQIIQVEEQDVGVLVVERWPDELYLGLIELLPGFQGRGIGTAIVHELIDQARAEGLPLGLHVLRTNEPARQLYEQLGLRVVAEEPNRYRMMTA